MHEDELLKNRQSACMASASPQPCIKNVSSLQIPSSISDTTELTSIGYYRLSISSCFTSGFAASLLLFFTVIYTDNCENFIEFVTRTLTRTRTRTLTRTRTRTRTRVQTRRFEIRETRTKNSFVKQLNCGKVRPLKVLAIEK